MKSIDELAKGDYIAFGFNYNGGEPTELIVSNITQIYKDKKSIVQVLVHFQYANHSIGEFIKRENIWAIGNPEGTGKIKGWTGKYDILNQEKINEILSYDSSTKLI